MVGTNGNRAAEYSLPPRDSHSHHQQYTPFVLSSSQDMHHHLPPLHHAHPHSHHTHSHSHSLPKGLDTQAVNLMVLPPYDALPSQNQAQQVQLPLPSHVSPPSTAHAGRHGQGGQQAPQWKWKWQCLFPISRFPRRGGIMSNGLPDPDSLLTPGGTAFDAVNGVLNGLNPGSCLSLLLASTMLVSRSSCRGKEPLMATSTTGRLSSK